MDEGYLGMQEATGMTKEIGELLFDAIYLVVIWAIVFRMCWQNAHAAHGTSPLARTSLLPLPFLGWATLPMLASGSSPTERWKRQIPSSLG